MEAPAEEVAVFSCGDDAQGLDADTARPARDVTSEVGIHIAVRGINVGVQAYLGAGEG